MASFGAATTLARARTLSLALGIATFCGTTSARQHVRVPQFTSNQRPSTFNCTERWQTVDADHFGFGSVGSVGSGHELTFNIRFFTYESYWGGPGSPIWFYAGNEANVETYVNATGLMWEHAEAASALIMFAEHRFYGESWPCGGEDAAMADCLNLLTHEQAMADYVQLLAAYKESLGATGTKESPVIAFGGSYGGMLAAWMRMKYPVTIAGAIAASAPILGFPGLPFYEQNNGEAGASYWDVVTYDLTPAAGSNEACAPLLAQGFELIASQSADSEGRSSLESAFGLCPDTLTENDADGYRLQMRVLLAFDDYAMGNYPFASNYISGTSPLPPFPARAACDLLAEAEGGSDNQVLEATGAAVNMLYNASGTAECFNLPPKSDEGGDGIWDVQWCTEYMCQETYFTRRPPVDSTLPAVWPLYSYNSTWVDEHCAALLPTFAPPRPRWIAESYFGGGATLAPMALPDVARASNIVFSNGEYDPWSAAGVVMNDTARGLVSVQVLQGAHHLDLMFATPDDPPGLAEVRQLEIKHVNIWAAEARDRLLETQGRR